MVRSLNSFFIVLFIILGTSLLQGQDDTPRTRNTKDYKNADQFDKFGKRRKLVGAWQINQLKRGALVVRLKTNRMTIDGLLKQGDSIGAKKVTVETYAINRITQQAYMDNFSFCRLYFIFSNSSDSLLDGMRSGIFLDSNLTVDPKIIMNEEFYLIAERDYGYNSTIGFIPELEARNVKENGNPIKQMAIIVKNKFGHQLKNPFPYVIQEKASPAGYQYPALVTTTPNGYKIQFVVNKTPLEFVEKNIPQPSSHNAHYNIVVNIPKHYTYEKMSRAIGQLDDQLKHYFQHNPPPDENKIPADAKPFLY